MPATSQIVDGTALTSTSVLVKWTAIPSAALYYLLMYSQTGQILTNETSTNSSAVVLNLQPSTIYHFYIVAANQAGPAARSKVWAVTTCKIVFFWTFESFLVLFVSGRIVLQYQL